MSILREYGKYSLYCDICGEHIDDFASFNDAVNFAKKAKWQTIKEEGVWTNYCPDCQD
jgi:hypothetical protein